MVADSTYQQCLTSLTAASNGATVVTEALLECVYNGLQRQEKARNDDLKDFLFIVSGAMIFFMQAGFAMLCAGSVRIKNVQNTMLKNLLDACGAALAFFLVGHAFAFGGSEEETGTTFMGTAGFLTVGRSAAYWFFQYAVSTTAVTIVAGTLAERCQMTAYLCYSVFLTGFVYPVVAHSIWADGGFLSLTNSDPFLESGVIDFAGGGVVHLTGGVTALCATLILGPRRGRFYNAQGEPLATPKPFPGHSVALQLLGTLVLWFGWFGFNSGSSLLHDVPNPGAAAAISAVNTALSAAAGGVSALFTNLYLEERRTGEASFSILMCMNGSLSGLVAVTSGCGTFEPWTAVVVGTIAGWIYIYVSGLLIRCRIDDAVDAIPVHMANGIWGLLATGLLASERHTRAAYGNARHVGFFYGLASGEADAALLANQAIAVVFIVFWTLFMMFPFFVWLNYMGWLRADSLEELVGLDISYHGRTAASGDEVKKEYVEAFRRHRGTMRNRRGGTAKANGSSASSDSAGFGDVGGLGWNIALQAPKTASYVEEDSDDPETNQEAAAVEALGDDGRSIDA